VPTTLPPSVVTASEALRVRSRPYALSICTKNQRLPPSLTSADGMACDVAQVSMVQRTVFGEHCDAVSSRDCELDGSSILLLARAIWLIASGYRGIRHVGHRIDVLLVEPMPHNRGTNIGLLQMIGEHNLNLHAGQEAADCVWRPAHCLGNRRTAGAFVTAQHGKDLRLLRVRPQTRPVDRLVHRSACCQRGANAGDGAYYLRDVNAAALGQPVPGVEQGLRSSREATRARPGGRAGLLVASGAS
jgi:hypothetical protein